jgi:hypothetical protein
MHLEMLERHIIRDDRGSSIASLRGIVLISCYLNLTQSLLDRYIMFLDKQISYSTILKSTLYHPPINVGQKKIVNTSGTLEACHCVPRCGVTKI